MQLKRLHDELLAQTSYLLGCDETGTAVVVDPGRDVDRYIAAAQHEHLRITHVTETHIHADFVSGARALARATGAQLVLSGEGGSDWSYRFAESDGARVVHHGDEIDVGMVRLTVHHRPGHTPEHIAFLVTDLAATEQPIGFLSGDFIFVGDVGRPDLLERAAHLAGTAEQLSRALYRSLRVTEALPDHVQIWPAHGAGSACGKALGAMPSSTFGYERLVNWALQPRDEDAFVAEVLAGQPEPPPYFAHMKTLNRDNPPVTRLERTVREINPAGFATAAAAGAVVIDVRSTAEFAAGHIAGVLNLPVGTSFVTWAGWLLPHDHDIIILADDVVRAARARHGLSLIGFDRVVGWAGAGVRADWSARHGPLATTVMMDVTTVANEPARALLDVRGASEWNAGHAPQATHRFLGALVDQTRDLPRDAPLAVHCQGGTRSAIAASLLQAHGFTNVVNVKGGFGAWTAAGLPVERNGNAGAGHG